MPDRIILYPGSILQRVSLYNYIGKPIALDTVATTYYHGKSTQHTIVTYNGAVYAIIKQVDKIEE